MKFAKRETLDIKVFFWIIPISRLVTEIQELELSITSKTDREWPREQLAYISFLETRTTSFQESYIIVFRRDRVCRLSQVWDRLVRGANERSERCDEDRNSKRLKNIVFFTRRYLRNEKSYWDKLRNVLKRQLPRFQWSFIRWSRVIILGVLTIQIFSNFNTV